MNNSPSLQIALPDAKSEPEKRALGLMEETVTRTVLCFGDSNTHGQIPGRGPLERYARGQRWGGVLESLLGPGWQVIEEGLSGRTTVHDDPIEGALKNGRTYLRPCLQSHTPLDLIIRTSGEQRLSNFMLWQAAYSEMVFTDELWPDFDGASLARAVEAFAVRERRYGGL